MSELDMALMTIRAFVNRLIPLATVLVAIVLAGCDGDGGGGGAPGY